MSAITVQTTQERQLARMSKWRALRAQGFTLRQIAQSEGVSPNYIHRMTQPRPDEGLCTKCCQPLKK